MTKLLTSRFKTFFLEQLLESVEEQSNTAYYVYTGVHGDVIGGVPTPVDDNREMVVDAYHNMIFGKRVTRNDMSLMIRYIPWETGKVFAMYDDNDDDLLSKDFYCQVDEGALIHTYKCLNNNFNAASTVEPSFVYVEEVSNYTFETSDGYVWKYMYSVSSTVRQKFQTQNYFPVQSNTAVQYNARPGAIDVIRIEQNDLEIPGGGKRYDNYTSGTFTTDQLRVNGNTYVYKISNTNLSYTAGFYTGCLIYISEGIGAGQYAEVTDYWHDSNGNFITIHYPFTVEPQNGTVYEIRPQVRIKGSGAEAVTAVARALVNATGSNSIYKVEILERGYGYDYISANVIANGAITQDIAFVPAELHPIYSPEYGHGADSPEELGATVFEVAVRFANSESNTLLTDNRYQQVGLLKDPAFANVLIEISNAASIFLNGEDVFKISPLRVNSNVNISNTTPALTGEMSVLGTASVVSSGTSGDYIPDDILTIEGGTALQAAQVKVLKTNVRTAAINAAGSGYTPGIFTANLNLGTAVVNATFQVTANSLGQCETIVITNPGEFTDNPPYLANSTPVGGSPGSGLTLNINMGLESINVFNTGSYALIPTDLATNEPVSNIGTGAGAELLLDFDPTLTSDFTSQFTAGDYIYITNPALTLQQLAVVESVTNSSHLVLSVNGFFNCSAAHVYLPRVTSSAELVEAANTTFLRLTDVNQELETGDLLVGISSGAKAQVNTIFRNGEEKPFDTFIQLYKYDITVLSSIFVENEIVYQGTSLVDATASGLIHSVVDAGEATYLYTSNQVGQFDTTQLIKGANSLAVASINESFSPEVKFGSGDILYMENTEPVNREVDKTETFQIIIGI